MLIRNFYWYADVFLRSKIHNFCNLQLINNYYVALQTLNDQKWDEAQSIEENPMLEIEMKAAQDKEEIENIK